MVQASSPLSHFLHVCVQGDFENIVHGVKICKNNYSWSGAKLNIFLVIYFQEHA